MRLPAADFAEVDGRETLLPSLDPLPPTVPEARQIEAEWQGEVDIEAWLDPDWRGPLASDPFRYSAPVAFDTQIFAASHLRGRSRPRSTKSRSTAAWRIVRPGSTVEPKKGSRARPGLADPIEPGQGPANQPVAPMVEQNSPPLYPPQALRSGWQGVVKIRAHISAQGQVLLIAVEQSSGHAQLDAAALRAVRLWIFRPAQKNGRAIAASIVLPIRFKISVGEDMGTHSGSFRVATNPKPAEGGD